jgi:hypothetical protein
LISTVAVLVFVAAVTSTSARPPTRPPCMTAGRTVAANRQARVYRVYGVEADYQVFACLLKPKRTVYLGLFDSEGLGVRRVSLNGPSVAYENVVCQHTDCRGSIQVRNLRSGVRRRSVMPPGAGAADRVLASKSGAVAWTRSPRENVVDVRALGPSGERLLDSGPDVDPKSLALAGSTVYWTRGSQPYSANLP